MENMMEELQPKTAFTIPVLGGIPVSESCVVTWIIMGILVLLSIILTRKLKKVPKGAQCVLEGLMGWLDNMFIDLIGEKGKKYIPFLKTLILYIAFSNIIGLMGFAPPTKDVNVTAALAGMAIIYVQAAFIIEKGFGKWLKSFLNPINLMDLITRPLSLCMRLFGNILGAYVIIELINALGVAALGLHVIASAYFDIFDGLLQAYVFVFLTSLYIAEAVEEEEH